MGVNLVNALYEYVMILEEDARRKQFNKIERMKVKNKAEKAKSNLDNAQGWSAKHNAQKT